MFRFILATTEIHKVPATVASRCQRFDFRRVPLKAMVDRLAWVCKQEEIEIESGALELVARQSTGSLRDALSLMDQLRVFSDGKVTLAEVQDMLGASGSERVAEFVDYLLAGDLASGLRLVNAVLDEGLDIRQFNRQIVEHLRQLMLIKSGAAQASGESLIDVTEEMRRRWRSRPRKWVCRTFCAGLKCLQTPIVICVRRRTANCPWRWRLLRPICQQLPEAGGRRSSASKARPRRPCRNGHATWSLIAQL